jgi:predicted metal-dependent HD superfamily phosphohydrolase
MDFNRVKTDVINRLEAELPRNLTYHNVSHTRSVMQAAESIALSESVDGKDITLVVTAALFHDTGFFVRYTNNESAGCGLAEKMLPAYGYSKDDISRICSMIMATEIPQHPGNKLEEILCDADLDYLGRDDFFQIADNLRTELEAHGRKFSDAGWIKFEIDFLEKHEYFTATSRNLRDPLKQENIRILKNALKESGNTGMGG